MKDRSRNTEKGQDPHLLTICLQDQHDLLPEMIQQGTPSRVDADLVGRRSPVDKRSYTSKHYRNLFPFKLRSLLDDAAMEHHEDIISWLPDGKSFKVHDPETFTTQLLGKYFHQKCFSSFTRQLYHYGFGKIDSGNIKGAFYHPKFQRDNILSCTTMDRKTARVHRLDHTIYVSYGTADVLVRPVLKGRPPRDRRESPLAPCLFSIDEESSATTDTHHGGSHLDDARLCDSPKAKGQGSCKDATSSLVARKTTTSNSRRSSSSNRSPAVSCPLPSCPPKHDIQVCQPNRIESSLFHNALASPHLDDTSWTTPLAAKPRHQFLCNDEGCLWNGQEPGHHIIEDDDETAGHASPKRTRHDSSTSDWLAAVEKFPWPCDTDSPNNGLDDLSMSGMLEPRSVHDMVANPIRIEDWPYCPPFKKCQEKETSNRSLW